MDTQSHSKRLAGLYLITPDVFIEDLHWKDKIKMALQNGVGLVQYRNKNVSLQEQIIEAKQLHQLTQTYHAQLFINDNPFLALEIGAEGVHLGQLDLQQYSIQTIKKNLLTGALVGVSCGNQLALAQQAQQEGADYVSFGRFFPSKTKPNAVSADISLLIAAKQVLSIPIAAIGGITLENAEILFQTNIEMLAVCRGIWDHPNIPYAIKKLTQQQP